MSSTYHLVKPRIVPALDRGFRPAALANRAFSQEVTASRTAVPLVIGLERADGSLSRFETRVFPGAHPRAGANLFYAERIVKFLLWQRGAWKLWVGGRLVREWADDGRIYLDADVIPVSLPAGTMPILLKVCNNQRDWGFVLRITGPDGRRDDAVRVVLRPE